MCSTCGNYYIYCQCSRSVCSTCDDIWYYSIEISDHQCQCPKKICGNCDCLLELCDCPKMTCYTCNNQSHNCVCWVISILVNTRIIVTLIYQTTNQISLSLSRGKDNNMESDQRFIAKDVKYESSSDRSGAQCGIPSRYYSGCWICNTTIQNLQFSFSNLSYYLLFHITFLFFCFFFLKLHIFAFTCFKNQCSIFTDYLYFPVNAFTSHKASCRSCVGGKMYHKIISMI